MAHDHAIAVPSHADVRAAVKQLTALSEGELVELGRGADSAAYLLGGEWVLRFPVTANAQRTLRRELALLEDLAPALPLPIPVFAHVGRRDGRLVFVGYRALRGEPLAHERLSALPAVAQQDILASLAAFLKALRAYPVSAARRAGVTEHLTSDAVRAAGRRPQARPCPASGPTSRRPAARAPAQPLKAPTRPDREPRHHQHRRGAPAFCHDATEPCLRGVAPLDLAHGQGHARRS